MEQKRGVNPLFFLNKSKNMDFVVFLAFSIEQMFGKILTFFGLDCKICGVEWLRT